MKKFFFTILAVIMLIACRTPQEVPFTQAHNYFVRNDAPQPVPAMITSQQQFDSYFGMAAFMGKDGKPTPIDFNSQIVLPVVLPVTDIMTQILPVKVEVLDDSLYYTYNIQTGEQLTYSIQPLSIILIDKKYETKQVVLKH